MLSSFLRLSTFTLFKMPEMKPPFSSCARACPTLDCVGWKPCLLLSAWAVSASLKNQPSNTSQHRPEEGNQHERVIQPQGSTAWWHLRENLISLLWFAALSHSRNCEMCIQGHSSFYQLGHCTWCHLLVDKPGHEKVPSWALPGSALEWPGSPGCGYQRVLFWKTGVC